MRTIFSWKLDMRSSGQLTGPPGTVLHYSLSQLEGLFCKKWDVLAMDSLPHTHMGQYLCKKRVFLPLFCKARTWKQEFWLVCPSSMDLEIWDRMKQKQYIHFFPTDCRTWSWKADHKKRKKNLTNKQKRSLAHTSHFLKHGKPTSCHLSPVTNHLCTHQGLAMDFIKLVFILFCLILFYSILFFLTFLYETHYLTFYSITLVP